MPVYQLVYYNKPVSEPTLGNLVSYSVIEKEGGLQKIVEKSENEIKFDFKKLNIRRKKVAEKYKITMRKSGKGYYFPIQDCGKKSFIKTDFIDVVKGKKGNIYFRNMVHCGLVWICPDCNYKISKHRADELYTQLKKFRENKTDVYFFTVTIQHFKDEKLKTVYNELNKSFNFANSDKKFKDSHIKYYRATEITYGENGFHPHFHCLFAGNDIEAKLNYFAEKIKEYQSANGCKVNDNTVHIEKWNENLDTAKDYIFKGMIEKEITAGSSKTGGGVTFWQMLDNVDLYDEKISEYVRDTKGLRQNVRSRNFFNKETEIKTDAEILKDDETETIILRITKAVFMAMVKLNITSEFIAMCNYYSVSYALDYLYLQGIEDFDNDIKYNYIFENSQLLN